MNKGRKQNLKRIKLAGLATGLVLLFSLFPYLLPFKTPPGISSSPLLAYSPRHTASERAQIIPGSMWTLSFTDDFCTRNVPRPDKDYPEASKVFKISDLHRLISGYHTGLTVEDEERLAEMIYQESILHDYDPELIVALILTESSFYNMSRSHKGALGLMQLLPQTAMEVRSKMGHPDHDPENDFPDQLLFDPHLNIQFGVRYLTYLHHRFGDLELALTAYNYGPTRVRQWLSEGQPLPTRYSQKVMAHYKKFLEQRIEIDNRS